MLNERTFFPAPGFLLVKEEDPPKATERGVLLPDDVQYGGIRYARVVRGSDIYPPGTIVAYPPFAPVELYFPDRSYKLVTIDNILGSDRGN